MCSESFYLFSEYLWNDRHLPVFEKLHSYGGMKLGEKEKSLQNTFQQLFREKVPFHLICSKQPRCVKGNMSFIVNTTQLDHVNDLLSDDTGSWRNNGMRKFLYYKNEDQEIEKALTGFDYDQKDLVATVHRCYYVNRDATDFRRIVTFVTGTT